MAQRFMDGTPHSDYFGPVLSSYATANTMGQHFQMSAPGQIIGGRFANVMTGNPTLRFGLFVAGVESVAQRVEIANVAVETFNFDFATPYIAGWPELAFQRQNNVNACFTIAVRNMSASLRQYYSGGKDLPHHGNQWGVCYTDTRSYSLPCQTPTAVWGFPSGVSSYPIGLDPRILPDEYIYEPSVWPHLYGAGHSAVALATPGSARTTGGVFVVKKPCLVHGVRFYTHDLAAWSSKCCIYFSNPSTLLGSGTIACNGRGVYDCIFASPISITEALCAQQRPTIWLYATVYNQTNVNYTYVPVTAGNYVLSGTDSHPRSWDIMVDGGYGQSYPRSYAAGDAMPSLSAAEIYPVSALVTAA